MPFGRSSGSMSPQAISRFRHYVVTHSEREPMFVTWARAGIRARRQRSARR
jgi:hypothetical protein